MDDLSNFSGDTDINKVIQNNREYRPFPKTLTKAALPPTGDVVFKHVTVTDETALKAKLAAGWSKTPLEAEEKARKGKARSTPKDATEDESVTA